MQVMWLFLMPYSNLSQKKKKKIVVCYSQHVLVQVFFIVWTTMFLVIRLSI